MEQSLTSWTDDLPLCPQSGIGISPNEVYKKNGRRTEMHANEDRSFHFRYLGNIILKTLCHGLKFHEIYLITSSFQCGRA